MQQNRYIDSEEEEEDGLDDEVFAQKMHQQLNSSRPRRAAAMQATAHMMVSHPTPYRPDLRCEQA